MLKPKAPAKRPGLGLVDFRSDLRTQIWLSCGILTSASCPDPGTNFANMNHSRSKGDLFVNGC